MLDSSATIDDGLVDERVSGILDDALVEQGNSWEERQDAIEELSGSVAEEIERRRLTLQDAYPFVVVSNSLTYRPSATGVYEFCLAASINPTGTASEQYSASAIFEYITRDTLVNFLGPGTRAVRTGWPAYASENRGTSPKAFFKALHEKCGEFKWNPQEDHPDDPPNTLLKDAGLDVVAWKPWPACTRQAAHRGWRVRRLPSTPCFPHSEALTP